MSGDVQFHLDEMSPVDLARLPLQERVVDRMANMLFYADEILDMLSRESGTTLAWLTPEVQSVYDRVNALIQQIAD